jgi:hypothetical protein
MVIKRRTPASAGVTTFAGSSGVATMTKSGRRRPLLVGSGYAGALILVFLLAGCGYRFSGGGESINPAIRTVFVDLFTNRTSEAYADTIFRSAFISRFVQEGRFRLAGSRAEADAICRGTIKMLQVSPLAYKAGNLSAEDRLTIVLEISFEERESGRRIWSDSAFTGVGDYPVTTVGSTETSRKNALIKLANDTAERAYRLIMSGF